MPVVTVDEAKHLVEKWMQDRKFSTPSQQMPDESLQEVNFSYNGKTETGFGFIVIQPKQATRVIIMASRLDVAKSHADALGSMKARKLEDLLWELKKELVLSTASYMIMPPTGIPKSIQFSREISFDELTEGKLADALGSITKSMVLTILLFSKDLGRGIKGMDFSSMQDVGCITSSVYHIEGIVPSLTSQRLDVYQRQPRELDRLKVNEISLEDESLLCSPSKIDKTLRRVITQGTPAEEIMKHSGIYTPTNDQFEYDIAIPSPPPNRRYKVTLKIRTIKKGKPTIVDSDWI